ncbi:MAG: phosphatidate cytidylyltransferase [Anaerotruncus sp.]|jgi:phosphatidate cytidylyltransferase|nr:phosphatidate cytidylyltransferase [Anaerotruncus sp.]
MKQRLISSAIGLCVLFVILSLFHTIIVNLAVAAIACMGVYELLTATGCIQHKGISAVVLLFAAAFPIFPAQQMVQVMFPLSYLCVVILFCILLRCHDRLHIEQIAVSFTCGLLVPFSLTTLVYQRDLWGSRLGIFYVLVSLGSAWLSDTGAYFAGRAFGKRKLAPYISPKKTVEGAVGGAIFAAVAMLLVAWLYAAVCSWMGYPIRVHYLLLLGFMPLFTGVSIIGDLSASIIKRQFGVKDYGSIMPGHGGIMDRFDSALMVAPLVYFISRWIPLAQLA